MLDFLESAAGQFGEWVLPLVMRDEKLARVVAEHPDFGDSVKTKFAKWVEVSRENYSEINGQLQKGYGLPELEVLRAETCLCIIQGHWQAAICLTNILLDAFLKLALVYSNAVEVEKDALPLARLLNSLSEPVQKYMRKNLGNTITAAHNQGLIDSATRDKLDMFRKRFRNAFFHSDMQSMFGDQAIPVTGTDFGERRSEGPKKVPIHSLPLLLGTAMWQNARDNAIPYFREVDALIRNTLPKVFPNLQEEQDEEDKVGRENEKY